MNDMWTPLLIATAPWLAALTLFCIAVGIYQTFFAKYNQASERFQNTYAASASASKQNKGELDPELFKKNYSHSKSLSKLALQLEQANVAMAPHEFQTLTVLASVLAGCIGFIAQQNILWALSWAVSTWFGVEWWLKIKAWLRMAKAEEQFPDVIDAMISCLKTGLGFHQAVHSITENFDDPWGTEFGKMAVESNMGLSNTEVLRGLYNRLPNADVELFTTAMQIYFESGGNLIELLSNLSHSIRLRYKLFRKIRTLSAQGKLSAGLIICIPFVLMSLMALMLPAGVQAFITHPIGMILMGISAVWMGIGVGVLFKIVKIEV